MTTTALIKPAAGESFAERPPLLSVVPVAGPDVFVYVAFGSTLLLLLVPPLPLLATLAAVALVVAAALVALVVLVVAIVKASFLLVHFVRGHRPRRGSLPLPQLRRVEARRV